MKAEILKILQMQAEGKLTQDQAAELLAILADQAREKPEQTPPDLSAGTGGAPGPRGGSQDGGEAKNFSRSSAAAIHGLVDTAIGVGTTIGRAASVFGGEVIEMVHRDEGGNSVTLSKVDAPSGESFAFNGNTINVSKVAHVSLRQAEVCGNTFNASKVSQLAVTRGQFSQCSISGSSVGHVTITGPESADAPRAGIRALTLNASKFARVQVAGASILETSTIQASSARDWSLFDSVMRDSKFNDANIVGLTLKQTTLRGLLLERTSVHQLEVASATLQDVRLLGVKISGMAISGGNWTDVKFRREAAGIGGRESAIAESTFENCDLSGCEFAGCTFRRTTFRNLKLTGLTVRNIDFTGLTLETEEAFKSAVGM